ncbi:hypothetical protein D9M68_592570 [compost metagenome]
MASATVSTTSSKPVACERVWPWQGRSIASTRRPALLSACARLAQVSRSPNMPWTSTTVGPPGRASASHRLRRMSPWRVAAQASRTFTCPPSRACGRACPMSATVTLPFGPDPWTASSAMPRSAATRRAAGVANLRSPAGAAWAACGGRDAGAEAASARPAEAVSGAALLSWAGASPSTRILAMTVSAFTTPSTATTCSTMTPSSCAGTSMMDLSVSISTSTSPDLNAWPGGTIQATRRAASSASPVGGTTMSSILVMLFPS